MIIMGGRPEGWGMEWEPTMITTQLIPAVLAEWSKNRGKLVFVMQSWGNIASFLGNASRGPNAERLLSRTYVQRNRLELYAEGLKRIDSSGENDYRRFLLVECLEPYAELDDGQKERLQALLQTDPYQEVESLMKTTYERGIQQGIERGIEQGIERGIERGIEQGERRLTLRLMEAKFGPLSSKVKQQVEALSPEALTQL
jgi:Domain of unknown function (DUF4351)